MTNKTKKYLLKRLESFSTEFCAKGFLKTMYGTIVPYRGVDYSLGVISIEDRRRVTLFEIIPNEDNF